MRLLLLLCILPFSLALYEDQVGKFDWRKQFVGCPRQAFFHKGNKEEQIIVSTRENVIASLSTTNGELNWRRIQEDVPKTAVELVQAGSKRIYTVSDAGKTLRAWNPNTGAVVWQKMLCSTDTKNAQVAIQGESLPGVYVYSCGSVFLISGSGEEIWKVHVGTAEWTRLLVANNEVRFVSFEGGKITVKTISDGKISSTKTLDSKVTNHAKCSCTGKHIVCFHSEEIIAVDVTASSLSYTTYNTGVNIREVLTLDPTRVAVRSPAVTLVLHLEPLKEIFKVQSSVEAASLTDKKLVAISGENVLVFDIVSGKMLLSKTLQKTKAIPVTHLFASSQGDSLTLFSVYNDCRTEYTVINLNRQSVETEWIREEGLARVASVEMIDLPLSESQQLIEDEFEDKTANIFSAFLHRAVSQLIQLQRWFVHSIHKIVSISESMTSKESFSQLLNSVKATSRPSSGPLERDYFNLRKMVVVASFDGVLFGIDSGDGTLLWRTPLGTTFSPLLNSLGEEKMPLFIQRSTSNYHLNGQAVVVFKDSLSGNGVLLVFDPISGATIERRALDYTVNRVDLLPFAGKNQIHSLVIVDGNEKVSFYPELSVELDGTPPIFVLTYTASQLAGKRVNLKTRRIETVWNANIHLTPEEKIIAVKGKPAHQRAHSQGRVLIDRNVQYKYSNPNLVAIATLDSTNYVLTIYLVDSVSGLIVHTSKLQRASGPIHLVHCENWVAYSYWSEKSRRTEIGIIELFEGEAQSHPDKFDSMLPTSKAPEVTAQSYVYAQGVEAMAVSETEQGLTTRSIILALPFGGLHEVSRKLLDANRPYDLTQEMREEGYIPYMPELPIATEEMVNYNQTIFKVKGIKTAPSGLESTSLMLAYGIDLFFTRLHPSGTFDILKDDFDHVLISLVLAGLFIGSFISKRIARNNALKASWS